MNERSEPNDAIREFLSGDAYAVVGASNDRSKYGNKVLRAYLQAGKSVTPVHPRETEIEGLPVVARLADLPAPVHGISVITPPEVTEKIVEDAARAGILRIWMQPGAESAAAVEAARRHGIETIAGGPCLLVAVGYRE